MGGNASKGRNNDELVDNLLADNYLKTPSIQRVFRAVDRGLYFTSDYKTQAYDDSAWRNGNIHLSAPGIYCEVLENLELGEGMSFLNLGSGTGYLNTMAGLILGSYGVNYGVEVYKDVIQYAYNRLETFKETADAIDEYDFCEPKFFEGNCLHLSSENKLYDRVYCGAACPLSYENYMKNLIKVNGVLVMPLGDMLVKVKRISETSWETKEIVPVNFANMILPSPCDANKPHLLLSNPDPLSLQDICRISIRQILVKIVTEENPQLKNYRVRSRRGGPGNSRIRRQIPPNFEHLLFINREVLPGWRNEILQNVYDSISFNSIEPEEVEVDKLGHEELEEEEFVEGELEEDELEQEELEESDEDMERSEKETDKEKGDSEMTERKSEGESGDSSPLNERFLPRMKRKKAHQTSSSNSDSGTDAEGMDGDLFSNAYKKPDNSDKELKVNSSLAGISPAEKTSNGAGCSSNLNEGSSSAESDDNEDEEEESNIGLHRCRKYREMMVAQLRHRKAKRGQISPRPFDVEESECTTHEPPGLLSLFWFLMREKIQSLPLPRSVQSYLNFHRTF